MGGENSLSGLKIFGQVVKVLLRHGIGREKIKNELDCSEKDFQEEVGRTALCLVGEEGVEEVKKIQDFKKITAVEAIYEYLLSDSQKKEQLKGELRDLQAKAVQGFIEGVLNQINLSEKEKILAELESLKIEGGN